MNFILFWYTSTLFLFSVVYMACLLFGVTKDAALIIAVLLTIVFVIYFVVFEIDLRFPYESKIKYCLATAIIVIQAALLWAIIQFGPSIAYRIGGKPQQHCMHWRIP